MYAIKHMQILKFQVLIEEKEYLKDQREKTGPKGNFQLGPILKYAVKKYKKNPAEAERLDRQQQDSSCVASLTSNIFPLTFSLKKQWMTVLSQGKI